MKKTCANGHTFYKSSDCNTCPKCNKIRSKDFRDWTSLPSPVRNALINASINTIQDLSKHSKAYILTLHGIGPKALPKLQALLLSNNLTFKPQS